MVICYNYDMKINKKTDIAIRVLLHLRNNKYIGDNIYSAHLISTELDVSYNNIRKIISTLNDLGFTKSKLGQNGGVSLQANYNQVSIRGLLMTFEEFEEDNSKINCTTCKITTSCNFDHITKIALLNFFNTYTHVYLDDL